MSFGDHIKSNCIACTARALARQLHLGAKNIGKKKSLLPQAGVILFWKKISLWDLLALTVVLPPWCQLVNLSLHVKFTSSSRSKQTNVTSGNSFESWPSHTDTMGRPSFWLWFGHFYLSDAHLGHPADLACTFEVDLCGWSSTSSATDVWLRQNGASSKGPDSANQGEYYLYAVPSLDGEAWWIWMKPPLSV